MIAPVREVILPQPLFLKKEALRYSGARPSWETELVDECFEAMRPGLRYHVCCAEYPITLPDEETVDLGFACVHSRDLNRALIGCHDALVFAASVGTEPDRLVKRYSLLSPARALICQGIGAQRIESLCDAFVAQEDARLSQQGYHLKPRFSPGYGDLPLALQKSLLQALSAEKRLGITLNDSLLMMPSKSVTAIAGIHEKVCENHEPKLGCAQCTKKNCLFRKGTT